MKGVLTAVGQEDRPSSMAAWSGQGRRSDDDDDDDNKVSCLLSSYTLLAAILRFSELESPPGVILNCISPATRNSLPHEALLAFMCTLIHLSTIQASHSGPQAHVICLPISPLQATLPLGPQPSLCPLFPTLLPQWHCRWSYNGLRFVLHRSQAVTH